MQLRLTAGRQGRLSSFLKGELKMSTGLMNRLKWGDAIRVNGVPEHTDFSVRPGDIITVDMEEQEPEYPAQQGNIRILYEDDWLLAADKPAGMLIHPSRSCFTDTMANYIAGYYEKTGQKSAFHPLTRLDRDTFGIVLIAKNAHIHALLQQSKPEKTYHALTCGIPHVREGIIDAPIARKPLPSLLREISPGGKPSVSRYRVLDTADGLARMALSPVTGRTHQLRLHCAYIGTPILGDPQYGTPESMAVSNQLGYNSQQLCARSLCLIHPITGQRLELHSAMDVSLPTLRLRPADESNIT